MNVFSNEYLENICEECLNLFEQVTTLRAKGFKSKNCSYTGPNVSLVHLFEKSKNFYFPNTRMRTDGTLFVDPVSGADIYYVAKEVSHILSLKFITIKKVVLIFNDLRFIYTKFVSADKICKDYFDRLRLLDIKEDNASTRIILRKQKIAELKKLSFCAPFSISTAGGRRIWMRYLSEAKGDSLKQVVLTFAVNWAKYMEMVLENRPKSIISNRAFQHQTAKDINGYVDLNLIAEAKKVLCYTWKYGLRLNIE